jgi:hypothetical protein
VALRDSKGKGANSNETGKIGKRGHEKTTIKESRSEEVSA